MGESPESRPLARDLSIGCAVKRTATRNPFRCRKTVARKESCAGGRPPARCAGFGRSVGCARGSQSRLQKSTGGVWPVATRGEEPREPTSGLATPGESIGAAKARRKPGPRRQSRDTGGGFPPKTVVRKRDSLGATCRWKAFWIDEAAPFDEGAGEAVLGASKRVGSTRSGGARGATESVRGTSPTWHAVDNAAARWQPPTCGCPRLHTPPLSGGE
jgi:hypothetical protein